MRFELLSLYVECHRVSCIGISFFPFSFWNMRQWFQFSLRPSRDVNFLHRKRLGCNIVSIYNGNVIGAMSSSLLPSFQRIRGCESMSGGAVFCSL